jgi:VWFA-related protein
VATGEELGGKRVFGEDNLVLLPPPGETVLGLWRATALVSGERIDRVLFLVDGERQLESRRRPFSAELRLAELPTEQVVRAEGYDAEGNLVAADQVVLNRPRAAFRVHVVSPPEGAEASGTVRAEADVSVPDEKRLAKVEFRVDDRLVATLTAPPWETDVEVPEGGDVSYLSVTAELDDGTRTEAVRFLNAGEGFAEQLEVQLVELYVAAQDSHGRLVRDLGPEDFAVFEEGVRQEVAKFELMDALPLTVGIVIDTSGSMADSLGEAQRAAIEFLRRVVEPGDRTFAVAFSDVATLLMPPTDDVDVVADALAGLRADGWTVLHDAVITGLSYFREIEGQQALVLLSDGDDTASAFDFDEALEYARRSEAAVYSIGLDIPLGAFGVRGKLSRLAEETGGRVFFINRAEELEGVYGEIEEELRSRYLLAYPPQPAPEPGSGFRRVEVEAERRGVKTRTVRGYYP